MNREMKVTKEEFKRMLEKKAIRPASLDDVQGTHHNKPIIRHPNTNQWFVVVRADR